MSFTVQAIKTMAETFAGTTVTITEPKAISAMLIASSIIGNRSGYNYEIASADYTGLEWNSNVLPENHLGVVEVNIDDDDNTIYTGWRVRGRGVYFNDSDTYVIHYKKLPTEPTALTSTVEVHDIYKPALWEFMLGYARLSKWEGEDSFGQQLLAEFEQRVAKAWRDLNRGTGPKQMIAQRFA